MLIPDVLQPGLGVVFCGTALGHESFRQRAYYAHPGNRFWPTLAKAGFTPHRLSPADYAQVTQYGIGLTDICKTAYGNDCDIASDHFDPASAQEKILLHAPDYLAFTSKRSASLFLEKPLERIAYGLQPETLGATALFVLPSPSGSASKYWDEDLWHDLATLVHSHEALSLEKRLRMLDLDPA